MMARNRGNWLITGWRLRAPPIPSLGSFIRLVSPPCTPMYASPAVSGSLKLSRRASGSLKLSRRAPAALRFSRYLEKGPFQLP